MVRFIEKSSAREALAFESYYREQRPRRFAYYVAYPLLFPYWLYDREARREFWMFRGYTVGSFLILLAGLIGLLAKGVSAATTPAAPCCSTC